MPGIITESPRQTQLRLIACPRVLSVEKDRLDVLRPAGGSVGDLLRSIGWTAEGLSARVFVDGELVPDAAWEYMIPAAGQSVCIRAVPRGGNGQGKDALRIVAMIGVIVASLAVPALAPAGLGLTTAQEGLTLAGSLVAASTSIVGSLALNALIPPARPKLNDLSGLGNSSNTLALTGTSNQLLPYGVVPRVYGRHRIYPPQAARPYTEVLGSDQYLRFVCCLGPGPLVLSDFKIGESGLDQFADIQIESRQGYPDDLPLTLYPSVILEDPLSIVVRAAETPAIRTSQAEATELSVDVTFFDGLWSFHQQAGVAEASVQIQVEYRKQGDTAWILASGQTEATASGLYGSGNAGLQFTAQQPGALGNNFGVQFLPGFAGQPGESIVFAAPNGPSAYIILVSLRSGGADNPEPPYSTAQQMMDFLNSANLPLDESGNTFPFSQFISVSLAPGSDGTGQLTPNTGVSLSGGRDAVSSFSLTRAQASSFRESLRWTVAAPAIYEVRLTRMTPDHDPLSGIHDAFAWTALRTIRGHTRVLPTGMAGVALRVRSTNQLNGTIDSFNCVAQSILPDWDAGTRQWVVRPTRNPASIVRDIHQGSANARPKPDDRIDLVTLQAFHGRCQALGFTFDGVFDFRSSVAEASRDVLAASRATPGYRDGKISVVEDIPQAFPVHLFTPKNSWGFRGTKTFVDLPHGLKVRFVNSETLQQEERLVLRDGYGVTGADGIRRDAFGQPTTWPEATLFETMEAGLGVTDPEQVFKLKRYDLAALELRPETFRLSCDFEHLVVQRGDLVSVQHDVPLMGLISGRIKALTYDSVGRATTVTLDESVTMVAGLRYGLRIRTADGSQIQREVLTVPGEQSTFTLLQPV